MEIFVEIHLYHVLRANECQLQFFEHACMFLNPGKIRGWQFIATSWQFIVLCWLSICYMFMLPRIQI